MARRKPAPKLCDAPGCNVPVKRGMLMCRPHWFRLPAPLRDAISRTWKARQIPQWSANRLEARRVLIANSPAALIDRITGDRSG